MNLSLVTLVYSDPKPRKEYVSKGKGGAHKAAQSVSDYIQSKYPKRNRMSQ